MLIRFYTGLHYRLFQVLKETGDTAGAADQETITKRLLRYAPWPDPGARSQGSTFTTKLSLLKK